MKARFIEPVGQTVWLTRMWYTDGDTSSELHVSRVAKGEIGLDEEPPPYDEVSRSEWGTTCDKCGIAVPDEASRSRSCLSRYDTKSGKAEPGDLFYRTGYSDGEGGCVWHDSGCDGRHLFAVLPNGIEWDIDGRATNCTKPKDNVHRCWVREGTPPNITAGKAGNTCAAGAGSIAAGDYHGFLRGGVFT